MKNENFEHCKAIATELEDIVNGYYKNVNGEPVKVETDDTYDLDTLDDYTIYDYFSDVYDIEWTLDSNFNYKAVRLMVACGGPNIYINTLSGDVELYWWTETARYPMSRDVINAIDEDFEEYFECCRH